jgi:hypothetical protein
MKGGRDRDVDEAHQSSFDLHQGFRLFRARDGNAGSFKRLGPYLAKFGVTPFKGCAHGVTKRRKFRPFSKRICACNCRPFSNSMRRNAITKGSWARGRWRDRRVRSEFGVIGD